MWHIIIFSVFCLFSLYLAESQTLPYIFLNLLKIQGFFHHFSVPPLQEHQDGPMVSIQHKSSSQLPLFAKEIYHLIIFILLPILYLIHNCSTIVY
jgi:hypothetical protein